MLFTSSTTGWMPPGPCHMLLALLLLVTNTAALSTGDNNSPKEKDVITNPICSAEALLAADISNNLFISRAEFVNLLLDLAPSNCPIIDSWLEEGVLQQTFEDLSCLCREYGGVEGETNCCLQAVGVPMLAAFAVPNSLYGDDYTTEACLLVDRALHQECPTQAPDSPTTSPTTAPTTSTTTAPLQSLPPTLRPTMRDTTEQTQPGDSENVDIQDGSVIVEGEVNVQNNETSNVDGDTNNVITLDITMLETEAPEVGRETEAPDIEEQSPAGVAEPGEVVTSVTEPPMPAMPMAEDATWGEADATLAEGDAEKQGKSVGIILAALFVVSLSITLVLLLVWGRRRRLLWRKQHSEPTLTSDDNPTPRRSNSRRPYSFSSNHSFSSDDVSTDDDDGNDIERPRVPMGSKGVVRAEFHDNLSVWGRRKRRRHDRKQRREERSRAMAEQMAPHHRNSISNILNTLELDVLSGAVDSGAGGLGIAQSMSFSHNSVSPIERDIDIFDDTSQTSSYDGSPQSNGSLQMETSIENWLEQVQHTCKSVRSRVMDDKSTASSMSRVSRGTASSRPASSPKTKRNTLQRQPQDPSQQDWPTSPKHQTTTSPFSKVSLESYFMVASRSFSPARRRTRVPIAPAASFSPKRVPSTPRFSQSFTILASSASVSSFDSPKRPVTLSQSVPASPVLAEAMQLASGHVRSHSDSTFQRSLHGNLTLLQRRDDSPPDSPTCLHLDLPVEYTHHDSARRSPAPPMMSHNSQEFYDSVLRLEPPDDEEDSSIRRGNSFAFEAVRASERYLV